ncbi:MULTISPECIES: hypothetical protein [Marinomonas]|uniref:Flagellar protein FlgN n=1 Tax=Marinomonas arctica TaxID=383750 RepID=A0A7H1J3P4_9GAMM|nr:MULTISPECIES: hypothetical protein [Marinomonas]MCS7487012.1 hypothetical protein [Marinomonas sp. BSi20414]QNT05110.1 hypothetical protein IBG28_15640 [Marinomonas arctica]GGN16064.1 hypothetical protein GCM10011350_01100 [Marinomonas arctica]
MLDLAQLTKLTDDLESAVQRNDSDDIQRLCLENNDFIFSIKLEKKNSLANEKIKSFIKIHQSAILIVKNTHKKMQDQLYQSIKTRKSVTKYKGVKHAE